MAPHCVHGRCSILLSPLLSSTLLLRSPIWSQPFLFILPNSPHHQFIILSKRCTAGCLFPSYTYAQDMFFFNFQSLSVAFSMFAEMVKCWDPTCKAKSDKFKGEIEPMNTPRIILHSFQLCRCWACMYVMVVELVRDRSQSMQFESELSLSQLNSSLSHSHSATHSDTLLHTYTHTVPYTIQSSIVFVDSDVIPLLAFAFECRAVEEVSISSHSRGSRWHH